MSRKVARKHAFVIVYQMPFHKQFDMHQAINEYLLMFRALTEEDRDFVTMEAAGTKAHMAAIDALITANVSGWTIERMAAIDVAIMRLCIFELMHVPEIPTAVAINEAVELCKLYGDNDAPAFVNGVLATVSTIVRGDDS